MADGLPAKEELDAACVRQTQNRVREAFERVKADRITLTRLAERMNHDTLRATTIREAIGSVDKWLDIADRILEPITCAQLDVLLGPFSEATRALESAHKTLETM